MSTVRLVATLQVNHSDDILGDTTGLPLVIVHEDFAFGTLGESLAYQDKLRVWLSTFPMPGDLSMPEEPTEERLVSALDRLTIAETRDLEPVEPVPFDPHKRFGL